jgi:predicted membrane protein
MPTEERLTLTPQVVVGICVMLFGVLLTLDRLHIAEAAHSLRLWPSMLVVIGAWVFMRRRDHRGQLGGVVLMVVGGWLLLNSLGLVRVRIWELFWPVVIILLGFGLVMQTIRRGGPSGRNSGGTATLVAVLGACKRTSSDRPFRGGQMTAVMGGTQLDLRQATIAPGDEAVVDVFAMMGGHEIWVPSGWVVTSQVMPLLGGVEDRRLPPMDTAGPTPQGAQPRLVLRGLVVMGGLIIKS